MGLSMFLFKAENGVNLVDLELKCRKGELPRNAYNEALEEVAYWRKANQIHTWFVENAQDNEDDCGYYEVTKYQLEELVATCKEVLGDMDKARGLLPTKSGFFFGSENYDEGYIYDINETIEQVGKILAETDFSKVKIYYRSSW
jgi:hypothetical protein